MSAVGEAYFPTYADVDALELETLDELLDEVRRLGRVHAGHQWWLGDLLAEAERRFGEEFAQAESVLSEYGVESQTAANWQWVATSIDRSRRREDLSWSHHAEVARLEPAQQKRALAYAAKNGLGVRELRDYVALTWPRNPQGELPLDDESPVDDRVVQRRLEEIDRNLDSWRRAGATQETLGVWIQGEDVRWLIEVARRSTRSSS